MLPLHLRTYPLKTAKTQQHWIQVLSCVCVCLHLQELCVDLELRNRPALLGGGLSPLLDPSEQVVDSPRNDTQLVVSDVDVEAGSHGVGLPRTRLDTWRRGKSHQLHMMFLQCVAGGGGSFDFFLTQGGVSGDGVVPIVTERRMPH